MPETLLARCLLFLLRACVVMGFSCAIACGVVVIPASYGDNPIKVCALSFFVKSACCLWSILVDLFGWPRNCLLMRGLYAPFSPVNSTSSATCKFQQFCLVPRSVYSPVALDVVALYVI
jgi:hypothetical protein